MVKTIGNVQKDAQVRAVASGALSNGDTIIVNSDGTVSAISGDSASEVLGSEVEFEAGAVEYVAATYDSSNNKVIIVFRDDADSGKGKAIVGTVSGTSISFGTAATFESASSSHISATFDSTNNKVVIAYRANSNNGYATAVVGTVSGTSISFGTAVVFQSNGTFETSLAFDTSNSKVVAAWRNGDASDKGYSAVGTVSGTSISFGTSVVFANYTSTQLKPSVTYDSNSNKIVISYRNNSDYGTSIVGTVSGTSISYGTEVVYNAAATDLTSSAFDSNANKVVVTYRDDGNSNYISAIVGTVSGTSISFGSEYVLPASGTASKNDTVFDATSGKIVIAYQDQTNSKGEYVVATVSGSTLSFGTATAFNGTGNVDFTKLAYDENSGKVVIAYRDEAATNKGNACVLQVGYTSTNLTSDNFIGFADGAYADTQSAVINTTCSVDRNQTSLTAGQKYYVQTDGSLGTTAADPSVEAGTAISSTEILVKG